MEILIFSSETHATHVHLNVTVLLESGLDVNIKDAKGSLPLEYALQVLLMSGIS